MMWLIVFQIIYNMGQVDTFEVTFDNNQDVYREGDQVEGFVRLVLSEELKYKSMIPFIIIREPLYICLL